jgi:glycosyltransferase involved in cell wall biosynthesis
VAEEKKAGKFDPSVTVILPVLNGAATIGDTLAALGSQVGGPKRMEVLVIDNGSTDGTQEIARKFPVTLLHEPKRGPSRARNCGLKAATGEILVCLDADTLPTRRWLRELIRPFEEEGVVLVGGEILSFQPKTASERYIDASGIFRPRHHVQEKRFPFVVGMNMAVRTESARAVGGWRAAFNYGEDVDISHRILKKYPGSLRYAEKALMFHRNRTTIRGLGRQAHAYGRGMALVYRQYPSEARWNVLKLGAVGVSMMARALTAAGAVVGRCVGLAGRERVELSACHAMWSWCFWRGFFEEYYLGKTAPEVE